ncbi:MAG: GNAT family N-acetyltransferase [Acidimicrobiia bacterium]
MHVAIKQLTADDWPLWRSVRLQALADSPTAFGSNLTEWANAPAERWQARLNNDAFNIIAFDADQPVGQVSATATPDPAIELTSMWVASTARGKGVGDTLINAVTTWAQHQQAPLITLSVKHTNHHARRLYERHGFTTTGPGDDHDELRMTRPLHT